MVSAHLSIIPQFVELLEIMGLENDFTINKTDITNKHTGNKIYFRGMKSGSGNQTANLKSLTGITCMVLEEAEELYDYEAFEKIDLSVRSKIYQNRVILLLNPGSKQHPVYHEWFEGDNANRDDTTYIHTTYFDNIENLSPSIIEKFERIKLLDYEKYERVCLGKFGSLDSKRYYRNYKTEEHISTWEYDPNLTLYVSVDKNAVPYCATQFAQIDTKTNTIHFFDEIKLFMENMYSVIEEFNKRYKNHKGLVVYIGDATSNARSSMLEKDDNFNKIFFRNMECVNKNNSTPRSNPSILDRDNWANSILAGLEPMKIRMTNNCKGLIEDMELLLPQTTGSDIGKKSKAMFKDTKNNITYQQYGHFSDCFSYILNVVYREEFLTYTRGEQSNPITININKPNRY